MAIRVSRPPLSRQGATTTATTTAPPVEAPVPAPTQAPKSVRYIAPSRRGMVQVAFFMDPDAKHLLDIAVLEERRNLQSVLLEAVDMWFQSRGKARVARRGGNDDV